MQRPGSSSSTPMWISSHPPAGGTRAPVAHAWAHGMSVHTTHAWMAGSMIGVPAARPAPGGALMIACTGQDRKSTRLNSSHGYISYAVFCLKQKHTRSANHFHLLAPHGVHSDDHAGHYISNSTRPWHPAYAEHT